MTKEQYFIEVRDAFYEQNDFEKKYSMSKDVYDNICAQFFALGESYNIKSSLPSNIDEAAEKYAYTIYPSEGVANIEVNNAFKAGAEWHAKQGQTFESVVWKDSDDELFVEAYVDENKFKMADNIIIQVRKKQ